jgi:hypothetical protein
MRTWILSGDVGTCDAIAAVLRMTPGPSFIHPDLALLHALAGVPSAGCAEGGRIAF